MVATNIGSWPYSLLYLWHDWTLHLICPFTRSDCIITVTVLGNQIPFFALNSDFWVVRGIASPSLGSHKRIQSAAFEYCDSLCLSSVVFMQFEICHLAASTPGAVYIGGRWTSPTNFQRSWIWAGVRDPAPSASQKKKSKIFRSWLNSAVPSAQLRKKNLPLQLVHITHIESFHDGYFTIHSLNEAM